MKFIKEFLIIITISFIGELLNYLLPLPIPASIYGLVIMLTCLLSGAVKLDDVKNTGKFLVEIMPMLFIPAAVGLLESWGVLKPVFLPIAVITVVSTVLVIAVAGRVTQWILRKGGGSVE